MTTPSERVEKYLEEAATLFLATKGSGSLDNSVLIVVELAKMLQIEYLKDEKQPIHITCSCGNNAGASGGSGPC